MGHSNHSSGEVLEELFEPVHTFCVQVVGRFVKKKHIRLGQQQTAECNTALFTAGEIADLSVPRRKTKCVSRDFHLRISVGTPGRDDSFQASLLCS